LDGQHGSYYQNASNLTSGTIPDARLTGSYTGLASLTGSGDLSFARTIVGLGTSSTPSITFLGDLDTGIYSPSSNRIGFVTNATERLTIVGGSGIEATLPFNAQYGSATSPSFSFTSDTNTGMYHTGTADNLAFATGGVARLTIVSSTQFTATLP
jgi:hypothetical protein